MFPTKDVFARMFKCNIENFRLFLKYILTDRKNIINHRASTFIFLHFMYFNSIDSNYLSRSNVLMKNKKLI